MMKWKARGVKWEHGYMMIPCEYTTMDEKKVYSIEIKDSSNRRSLNANAYAWVLIGELAKVLRVTREEVYRDAIRQVGTSATLLIDEKKVNDFVKRWGMNGTGWFAEPFNYALGHPGKVVVMVYYGSSTYSSSEMSLLIDHLIFECKEQDIETMNETDLKQMLDAWGN